MAEARTPRRHFHRLHLGRWTDVAAGRLGREGRTSVEHRLTRGEQLGYDQDAQLNTAMFDLVAISSPLDNMTSRMATSSRFVVALVDGHASS